MTASSQHILSPGEAHNTTHTHWEMQPDRGHPLLTTGTMPNGG